MLREIATSYLPALCKDDQKELNKKYSEVWKPELRRLKWFANWLSTYRDHFPYTILVFRKPDHEPQHVAFIMAVQAPAKQCVCWPMEKDDIGVPARLAGRSPDDPELRQYPRHRWYFQDRPPVMQEDLPDLDLSYIDV